MKTILLCAGFATRLFPLTKDRAKPLLTVAGKPILEHLFDQLMATGRIEETLIVTNARFFAEFEAWRIGISKRWPQHRIHLFNDGAHDNDHRLGAVRDLALGVEQTGLEGPILIAAADNLYRFSMTAFLEDYASDPRSLVLRYRERDRERLRRTGVAEIDDRGRVVRFHEKPRDPPTDWACPAFYLLDAAALSWLKVFVTEEPEIDAPGHFIAWLSGKHPVFTHEMQGSRLDVGDIESYEKAESWFRDSARSDG